MTTKTAIEIENGQRLRAAREKLGLTPEELAPLLGYGGRQRVYEIESGLLTPSKAVERLFRAYIDGYRPHDWPARLQSTEPTDEEEEEDTEPPAPDLQKPLPLNERLKAKYRRD